MKLSHQQNPLVQYEQPANLKRELRQLGHTRGKSKPLADAYITPPVAIEELLTRETFKGQGWEPASGSGAIIRYLPKGTMASDIREDEIIIGQKGVDFLWEYRKVDWIITNPPYSLALEFAKHSLECADKVALLYRIQFLEGVNRHRFFMQHPPKRIWVFADRIMCIPEEELRSKNPNCVMCFAWFVWEKDFVGRPTLDWILTGRKQNRKDMLR